MQVKLIKSTANIANAPLMTICALAGAGIVAGMIAFLWPAVGWAWGPVTHLSFGLSLMDQLQLIAPRVAALLSAYPRDFLYGCLSADITLGKRFVAHESHHCHNWSVGFDVLKAAKNDRQRSFAYGYLCHLAADTIAHNLYVPYKIAASFETTALKHTYWEIRYDALVEEEVWAKAFELIQEPSFRSHNELLQKTLKRALFSFKTNKRIFNSLIVVQNMKQWRKLIGYVHRRSKWTLPDQEAREYRSLVNAAIVDFFTYLNNSSVVKVDPSGHEALKIAHSKRRDLKELHANEVLPHDMAHATLEEMREYLIGRLPEAIAAKRHAHLDEIA